MPSPEFYSEQWEDFADEYAYLSDEVYDDLNSQSHLFDVKFTPSSPKKVNLVYF